MKQNRPSEGPCPVCDRFICPVWSGRGAHDHPFVESWRCRPACNGAIADADCKAHAVNWRDRALAVEAHGEKPADLARDLLRGRLGNELWDAINRYAVECGGDPSTNIYGATRRQAAVAEIVRVVEAVAVATAGGKR